MSVTEITSTYSLFPDLREAWRHRQIAYVLLHRNIKVRYTQTLLGAVWIVIQPLLLTGVLTLFFGFLLAPPSDGLPYGLFALAGISVWTAFQRALQETSSSLVANSSIILKVYFPRILVPISAAMQAVIDILFIYVVLLALIVVFGQFSGSRILLSPLFVVLGLLMAFAAGLVVTQADAIFRDVRFVVPSMLQLLLYATPIMYSETVVPERWLLLYRVNPLVGVVRGFRWTMLADAPAPNLLDVAWSCGFTALLIVAALLIFARLEYFLVDRI